MSMHVAILFSVLHAKGVKLIDHNNRYNFTTHTVVNITIF